MSVQTSHCTVLSVLYCIIVNICTLAVDTLSVDSCSCLAISVCDCTP